MSAESFIKTSEVVQNEVAKTSSENTENPDTEPKVLDGLAAHFASLRAHGVPEAEVAALEAIFTELVDAVQEAHSALHEASITPEAERKFQATSARWKLAQACARAGYPVTA